MSDAAQLENRKQTADDILTSLREQYEAWEPVEGQARKKLWKLLGDVYEAIGYFEANPTEMEQLREAARAAPGVLGSERFKPFKEKAVDLLLVTLLGLRKDTAATKSQWRFALMTARLARCQLTSEAFQGWLTDVGGLVGARKVDLKPGIVGTSPTAAAKKAEADELVVEKFDLEKFAKGIADSPPKDRLKVAIDRQTETYGGLSLALLFVPEGAKNDGVHLVEKIGDPAVLRRVCTQVALGHVKQLSDEEKRERLVDHYLWTLNQVALTLAGRLRLKFGAALPIETGPAR